MKATINNIKYIAKQTLYKGEGEDELSMNILLDNSNGNVSIWVENYDGEKVESSELTIDELCDRINGEGWDFNEKAVEDELALDNYIANSDEIKPVAQTYTCKNGHVMNVYFADAQAMDLTKQYDIENMVKAMRGWADYKQGGYILRSKEAAQLILDAIYE